MPESIQFNDYFTSVTLTKGDLPVDDKFKQVFGLPNIEKSNNRVGIVSYRSISKTPL
jgi:hypothetical protein